MGYSITDWSFSVALTMVICCQLSTSAPSENPESDRNCIPVERVTKDDSTWNQEDRVYICQLSQNRFDIHSYEKNERIVFFNPSNVVFKEQWALSLRFEINSSRFLCTFSHIEYARAFYARVNPTSELSPQNFTLRRLESCWVRQGKCENRRPVSNQPLVFHQHFIDSRTTKFTFEPADGLMPGQDPPLMFSKGEFQLYWPGTRIILTNRSNLALCYVLYLRNYETTDKFFDYISPFIDDESLYSFPEELRR